jgi:hypothetical protein
MSCPYFYPLQPRSLEADSRSAMLPLGNVWAGVCRAVAGESLEPDEAIVKSLCHLGYARGQCGRFPADDGCPDAVRFTVRRDDERSLELYYVLERDHHPLAHGALEYSRAAAGFAQPPGDAVLARQAEAYVASYLWRKAAG